jgi:hypothetical protein
MATKPLFVLSIAFEPTEPAISLHTSQEAAEVALQEYAQREWNKYGDGGSDVPMPATPNESAQYLNGPANYACAQVFRVCLDDGPGESVSLAGRSKTYLHKWYGLSPRA